MYLWFVGTFQLHVGARGVGPWVWPLDLTPPHLYTPYTPTPPHRYTPTHLHPLTPTTALKDANYCAFDLKHAGFPASGLAAAGFTAEQMLQAGYVISELDPT